MVNRHKVQLETYSGMDMQTHAGPYTDCISIIFAIARSVFILEHGQTHVTNSQTQLNAVSMPRLPQVGINIVGSVQVRGLGIAQIKEPGFVQAVSREAMGSTVMVTHRSAG